MDTPVKNDIQPTPEQEIILNWYVAQFFIGEYLSGNERVARRKQLRDSVFRNEMDRVTQEYELFHLSPTSEQKIILDWWEAKFFDGSIYRADKKPAESRRFRDNTFRKGMNRVTQVYRQFHPAEPTI